MVTASSCALQFPTAHVGPAFKEKSRRRPSPKWEESAGSRPARMVLKSLWWCSTSVMIKVLDLSGIVLIPLVIHSGGNTGNSIIGGLLIAHNLAEEVRLA